MVRNEGEEMTKVCYVIYDMFPSGGNKMAFEHLNRLAEYQGFECFYTCCEEKLNEAKEWLVVSPKVKKIPFTKKALEEMDYVTLTYFETYYKVQPLKLTHPKGCYFVQCAENLFFSDEVNKNRVRATYFDQNYQIITEAKWIQEHFRTKYNKFAFYTPNHIEIPQSILDEVPKWRELKAQRKKPIVLIEGNAVGYHKGIHDSYFINKRLGDEFEFWLLTNAKENDCDKRLLEQFDKTFHATTWEEALKIITQADILFKPSRVEGLSGPIMEAQQLEVPVIAYDMDSTYEQIIDGYSGLIVPMGQAFRAGDALLRLKKDKDLRFKIIENAKRESQRKYNNWRESIDTLAYNVYL
jgi:glycosyltransferase involved in cell wall biosynthesis